MGKNDRGSDFKNIAINSHCGKNMKMAILQKPFIIKA
jgi:hypothetical protein